VTSRTTLPVSNQPEDRYITSTFLASVRVSLVVGVLAISACATNIPKDALALTPDTLAQRHLQTRRFDGIDEKKLLAASAQVLQDLGFNLDESETRLGVLVASKDRSAVSKSQVTAAVMVALLGGGVMATDKLQKIRMAVVARPVLGESGAIVENSEFIRVTIQRTISNTANQVTRIEAVDDPLVYQEFFDRLSKSVFLEGQKI
jgi:hypothetical protein